MATSWIAGITVGEGGHLCPLVEGGPIPRTAVLADLAADLGFPEGRRRKVSFSLHELQSCSTAEYLSDLGFPHLSPAGQPAYEVRCSLGTLVIPAQLLVLAILGTHRQLRQNLLAGHGPGLLATVLAGPHRLDVLPTPKRMDTICAHMRPILRRLEWLQTYPSAQSAWGSVYRRALNGQFDMRMPVADVEGAVWVYPVAGRLLVTKLAVMKLLPREAPCEFAGTSARREFVFNEKVNRRPTRGTRGAPTRDDDIASSRGPGPLTDAEWLRVEPALAATYSKRYPGNCRKYSLREITDVILHKVGTPYSWRKMPGEPELVVAAAGMFTKLKRKGAWEKVVATLTSSG